MVKKYIKHIKTNKYVKAKIKKKEKKQIEKESKGEENEEEKSIKKGTKGIKLIALVITIIVLLILAGITIGAITGQNGTINQANAAKEQTEIAQEKETLEIATVKAMGKDKEGNVTKMYLDQELDESVGVSKYSSDDQTTDLGIIVTYLNSGRSYLIDASGNVTDYDKDGNFEEPDNTLEIGDYVEYNVTYTDMYTDHSFTSQDGWRVLDPGTENVDGTYSGVKLISTGVPANLDYTGINISDKETDGSTIGKWAGNAEQRKKYADEFYTSISNDVDNMYAAAGLYYNFGLIKFVQGSNSEDNVGEYKQIGDKSGEDISGKEFIVGGVAEEVHNLTLAELNKARGSSNLESASGTNGNEGVTGLFYLKGLNNFGYSSSVSSYYWLASPDSSNRTALWYVHDNGNIYDHGGNKYGLRPVVSLKSNIQITEVER